MKTYHNQMKGFLQDERISLFWLKQVRKRSKIFFVVACSQCVKMAGSIFTFFFAHRLNFERFDRFKLPIH